MIIAIKYIITAVVSYLLGSISTGLLVAKFNHGPNLRETGSKNTGASNVRRTMGTKYGLITFLGDALKAAASCLIGLLLCGQYGALLAGIMVILGHNWPIFFGFKGGKGVASSCGVMLVCYPVPALICFAVAIAVIFVTKYISVGSMTMLTLFAVLVTAAKSGGDPVVICWAVLMALLCILRHRTNIVRLMHHSENKFTKKKKA